jgi:hypothetical protein
LYWHSAVTLVSDIHSRIHSYPTTEFASPTAFNEFGQAFEEASGSLYFLIIV